MWFSGIEEHLHEGVRVRVFSAVKTVADCFKFRNKIGLDVALEALRDYRRKYRSGMDDLWRFAKICRVTAVMRPLPRGARVSRKHPVVVVLAGPNGAGK